MSSLEINGNKYDAFSGMADYRNKSQYICLAKIGPIPIGTYYIVDRQSGGRLSQIRELFSNKREWFALYKKDDQVDDFVFCDSIKRGQFRLHPKGRLGISEGCITIDNMNDYSQIRNYILNSPKYPIPNSAYLTYGIVAVS